MYPSIQKYAGVFFTLVDPWTVKGRSMDLSVAATGKTHMSILSDAMHFARLSAKIEANMVCVMNERGMSEDFKLSDTYDCTINKSNEYECMVGATFGCGYNPFRMFFEIPAEAMASVHAFLSRK